MAANKFAAGHVSLKLARIERNSAESLERFAVTIELYRKKRRARVIAIAFGMPKIRILR